MTGSDVALRQSPTGALAIAADQQEFTDAQLEAFGIREATRGEQLVFLHTAQRTGLDPAVRQIYSIGRWDKELGRKKYTVQTGIDGYRLIADRTGRYAGSRESWVEGNAWHPFSATVTVYKIVAGEVREFSATAHWDEYVQMTKTGEVVAMWRRMPRLMLAKCAEALALRKAFPQELSGIYTDDEMRQADTHVEDYAPPQSSRGSASSNGSGPSTPPAGVNVVTGEVVDVPADRARVDRQDGGRVADPVEYPPRETARVTALLAAATSDISRLRALFKQAGDDALTVDVTGALTADQAAFAPVPDGQPIPLKVWLTACAKQVERDALSVDQAIAADPTHQPAEQTEGQEVPA